MPLKKAILGHMQLINRKMQKLTGYDLAYGLYRPHITLTRYTEDNTPTVFPAFPEASLSFPLKQLGLYEANEDGAVFKEYGRFPI